MKPAPILSIITVIPLTRGKGVDELSYFTSAEVPVGAVVSVPLRSKSIHAIVTDVRIATDLKGEIKNSTFQLKKLGRIKTTAFFPVPFMEACKELAEYYATTIGAVIDSLVSDSIIENISKVVIPVRQNQFFNEIKSTASIDETYAIQGDNE